MSLVGLPRALADALPGQLSGGQRQRVAIARALALDPDLVVADEPTSALDVSVRAQILNLLLDLKERLGLALVFVSHDIQTVRRMSDRVITMYLGRIVEESPAALVTERARHPYTRALFSATPGLLDPIDPIPLAGPVPSATRPPSGCPFRTRCWKADGTCAEVMPGFSVASAAAHRFRCHHPVQEDESTRDLVRRSDPMEAP
jgi:peptide/nickel transport system ATP-binding protein